MTVEFESDIAWKGEKPPDNAIMTTNITTGIERNKTTKKHLKKTLYFEDLSRDSICKLPKSIILSYNVD